MFLFSCCKKDTNKKRKRTNSLVLPYIVCYVCKSRTVQYVSFNCNHNICNICLGFFTKDGKLTEIKYEPCNLCKLHNYIANEIN